LVGGERATGNRVTKTQGSTIAFPITSGGRGVRLLRHRAVTNPMKVLIMTLAKDDRQKKGGEKTKPAWGRGSEKRGSFRIFTKIV